MHHGLRDKAREKTFKCTVYDHDLIIDVLCHLDQGFEIPSIVSRKSFAPCPHTMKVPERAIFSDGLVQKPTARLQLEYIKRTDIAEDASQNFGGYCDEESLDNHGSNSPVGGTGKGAGRCGHSGWCSSAFSTLR